MLKLGCNFPNLANICLHKSTNYKFYPFCESDKDLCEKIRAVMTGGPSIVFTQKAVVDETYIRSSSNNYKSFVGIDASQLHPFSMCQDMPTGLYTRWEFDTDMQKFKAGCNRARNFENMVMSFYQESRPECKIESFFTSGNRILSEETRRERWMMCDENTLKRKNTKLKKCRGVTGGKVSKPMTRSKITSEPTFPIKDLFLQTPF